VVDARDAGSDILINAQAGNDNDRPRRTAVRDDRFEQRRQGGLEAGEFRPLLG
jgi:hypothetical protein